MEAKERMAQLLLQVSEADDAAMPEEWMDLEPVLSIQDLFLLLGAADRGSVDMYEPMTGVMMHAVQRGPDFTPSILTAAWMDEANLLRLAQQARLERLGLLAKVELKEGDWELALTPRGAHALNWWLGCLKDLGLTHDALEPDELWRARETLAEAGQASLPPSTRR